MLQLLLHLLVEVRHSNAVPMAVGSRRLLHRCRGRLSGGPICGRHLSGFPSPSRILRRTHTNGQLLFTNVAAGGQGGCRLLGRLETPRQWGGSGYYHLLLVVLSWQKKNISRWSTQHMHKVYWNILIYMFNPQSDMRIFSFRYLKCWEKKSWTINSICNIRYPTV